MTGDWVEKKNQENVNMRESAKEALKKKYRELYDYGKTVVEPMNDEIFKYENSEDYMIKHFSGINYYEEPLSVTPWGWSPLSALEQYKKDKKLKKLFDEVRQLGIKYRNTFTRYDAYKDSPKLRYDGDIIITDPCYIISNRDEWDELDEENDDMFDDTLPQPSYFTYSRAPSLMYRNTIFGDWSCDVYDKDKKKIGAFCADSGMVCVITKEDALALNPEFEVKNSYTTAVIDDFHGDIWFEVVYDEDTDGKYAFDFATLHVCGEGVRHGKPFTFRTSMYDEEEEE